jgi:hypothetical protein
MWLAFAGQLIIKTENRKGKISMGAVKFYHSEKCEQSCTSLKLERFIWLIGIL